MMNSKSLPIRRLTAALVVGTAWFGFASTAGASAMYDADATFSFTLDNVTNGAGEPVNPDTAIVEVFGGIFDTGATTTGVGNTAGFDTDFLLNGVDQGDFFFDTIQIGDTYTQSASAFGQVADEGGASSFALTDHEVFFQVQTGGTGDATRLFTFSWEWAVSAEADCDPDPDYCKFAEATALVDLLGDFGFDVFAEAVSDVDQGGGLVEFSESGTFTFVLDNDINTTALFSGFIDASGKADIPAPATMLLLGLGLAGMGYQQRRKAMR
jgi:hypothetical protein